MSSNPQQARAFFYVLQEETRILYVDDDPILREFACVNLASDHATVATAADGVEALAMLGDIQPNVVILDLEMPRMSGFEVLARLRDDPAWAGVPVIVATGREDLVAVDRAFELGATSFVVKPVHWRLLGYQIRYVLKYGPQPSPAPAEAEARLLRSVEAVAVEGARFIAAAVRRDPAIRRDASHFARALEHAAAIASRREGR